MSDLGSSFKMNFRGKNYLLWQTTVLLSVTCISFANPGEEFLNSIITRLKQEHIPNNYQLIYNELFGGTSRSSDEYQIHETPETSENFLVEQNNEFDQSQNEILQQFQQLGQIENQANFVAGNDINQAIPNNQQNTEILGLQQFNINGYLNLPPIGLSPEITQTSELNIYDDNKESNQPNTANANQVPAAVETLDINNPQLFLQHLQNAGQVNEAVQNNGQLVPTYYFYNPENTVDDNLIEDTINAMKPLGSENAITQSPGKTFVVEPLFVAMAGFVGIAMIFMSAVLFLPKILTPPPEVSSLKGPQELAALTKLAVETIEGNDCTERIACEVGRAMRNMQVSSKPIQVLEVLLPAHMAKQLAQIRKAVADKKTCKLIQCKRLKPSEQKTKTIDKKLPKIESEVSEEKLKIGEIKLSNPTSKPLKTGNKKILQTEPEMLVTKTKNTNKKLITPEVETTKTSDKKSPKPEQKISNK